ncbi:MAG: hypothetical protein JNL82_09225 [Myxococcales bacterium]|nr:hypothetical protein [Myxococcales bacterium]
MRLVRGPEDPLERFLAEVDRELAAPQQRGGRVRDFGEMMARAHRLDPAVTPASAAREAAGYAPVVALAGARPADPGPRVRPRLGLVLGLAAALLVGVAIGTAVRQARRDAAPGPGDAVQFVAGAPASAETRESAPVVEAAPRRPRGSPGPAADEPSADEAGVDLVCTPEDAAPVVEAQVAAIVEAAPVEPEYHRLDRAADAAWRRGDINYARELLTRLTRSEAPRRVIEAAYGDLGVLIRQAGDDVALAELWRRYLKRFPRGVFAEDARADLCRLTGRADCDDAVMKAGPDVTPLIKRARAAGEG